MIVNFPEAEEIYFPKTKEYFQEVISSYSIGNYRSAIVMLYSIVICDLLFKLQELKDMYNDSVANSILTEIEKVQNDNKSRSKWEKELVEMIYKRTHLLDLEAKTNLEHLYDYRNFSAHPVLNNNYELLKPSKEITVALIKNVLRDVLVKPPIFIKNVIETITEDLSKKSSIFDDNYDDLATYLNNKYYSKMPDSMKESALKAFWKFCFCLPDDANCMNNLMINEKALEILIDSFKAEAFDYIFQNRNLFTVSTDHNCTMNFIMLLSKFPQIYQKVDKEIVLQVEKKIDENDFAKCISWFKFTNLALHIEFLKSKPYITITINSCNLMISHYSNVGEIQLLIKYLINYYGNSDSYNRADQRFDNVIVPLLKSKELTSDNIKMILSVSDNNTQIWGRSRSIAANTYIMQYIVEKQMNEMIDFSEYNHFNYDTDMY